MRTKRPRLHIAESGPDHERYDVETEAYEQEQEDAYEREKEENAQTQEEQST